jgi:hypothetical protein
VVKETKEMVDMTNCYFQQLYTTDPNVAPHDLLSLVDCRVSAETNEESCKDFTSDEISDALFQIGPLKAPGPNGFPGHFFQKNWEVLKQDVVTGVRRFFEFGQMPPGVNDTSIVLILKKEEPELLKDFRPISLCNVIYKVVSKCLVNRLRPLLQDIIAPTQSVLILGRIITDNALIAYKLNLTKAYDHVDWGYLEGVLRRLGFHSKWINGLWSALALYNTQFALTIPCWTPSNRCAVYAKGTPFHLTYFCW